MSEKTARAGRKSAAAARPGQSARPKSYALTPARGQALLNYQGRLQPEAMPLYEADLVETVNPPQPNLPGAAQPQPRNHLLHGDCLSACAWMRRNNLAADLVYIDPPFASGADYAKKILLRQPGGAALNNGDRAIGEEVMYDDIWQKEDYLNWLHARLLAIREVMAEHASIYVHLDWHIGHYAKILMDEVFGEENFRNEIVWRYGKMAASNRAFLRNHDIILFYSKSAAATFNVLRTPRDKPVRQLKREVKNGRLVNARDENGNLIYVDIVDKLVDDCWDEPADYWDDIPRVMPASREYANYATQKPEALLRRVICASSNEGDLIADFFCGAGAAAAAAHKLKRRFIGGDVGLNAIQTTRDRLREAGASFDILRIRDGIRLFRNPAQTARRIFELIPRWQSREHLGLGEFWDGGVVGRDGSFAPAKFAGMRELLTRELVEAVLGAAAELGDAGTDAETALVVYAHKADDVDQAWADRAARRYPRADIKLRLLSLDELLAKRGGDFYPPDSADVSAERRGDAWRVRVRGFYSPYLAAKLAAFNAARRTGKAADADGKDGADGKGAGKRLRISERGLELVECAQFDLRGAEDGPWQSDAALEDRPPAGKTIRGEYEVKAKAFRLKLRSVAGDELILSSTDMEIKRPAAAAAKRGRRAKKE